MTVYALAQLTIHDRARYGRYQCPEPEVRIHRAANSVANFGFKGALES
jgi:hypothetical protein